MKKIRFGLFLAGVLVVSNCIAQSSFDASINGKIEGLGNDSLTLYISYNTLPGSKSRVDTVYIPASSDKFKYHFTAIDFGIVQAQIGSQQKRDNYFRFFLEPGNITISGIRNDPEKILATGPYYNNEYNKAHSVLTEIYAKRSAFSSEYQKMEDKNTPEAQELLKLANSATREANQYQFQYAVNNPNSMASALFLYVAQDRVPLSDFEPAYNKLHPTVKHLALLSGIPEKIKARKRTVIGAPVIPFSLPDTSGQLFDLSAYKGKYVLIDFWASWCVRCRKENPFLIKAYEKFQSKGFEIVGISCDLNLTAWKKAIVEDQLKWVQVSDPTGSEPSVYKQYGVQPIPDNFLIDPRGNIIARRLRGEEVLEKLEKIFQ